MALKVAINGLGRIGRCVARICADREDIELVACNASGTEDMIQYGLRYDSVHGNRKDIEVKDGYIYKDGEFYTIKDEMEIKQINIKTGNVRGAKDSNVKLEVKESDALKVAISDNMTVETTVLIVRGNVGKAAKINAQDLKVHGQTHQKATIYADKAFINVHKGYIEGKEIEINRLEGGAVKGKKVKIMMLDGSIKKGILKKVIDKTKITIEETITKKQGKKKIKENVSTDINMSDIKTTKLILKF